MTETITLPAPPVAPVEHTEKQLFGHVLTDDYAWLRDKEKLRGPPKYLEAEKRPTLEGRHGSPRPAPRAALRRDAQPHQARLTSPYPIAMGGLLVLHPHRGGPPVRHPLAASAATPTAPGKNAAEEVFLDGKRNGSRPGPSFAIGANRHLLRRRPPGWPTPSDNTGLPPQLQPSESRTCTPGEVLSGSVRARGLPWFGPPTTSTSSNTVEDEEQKGASTSSTANMRGTPYRR